LAEHLAHPFSQAFALWHLAECHRLRREGQLARERAEVLLVLSTEQGFPHWLASGTHVRGGALMQQGLVEESIVQMQHGLAAHQVVGTELGRTFRLALLAEAYGKIGQPEEGLMLLAEALAIGERTGERFYEAELYRLKGELLLAQESTEQGAKSREQKTARPNPESQSHDPRSEAEECFHKAIEIARKQHAKSLELRASASLARLWQRQGKCHEAHKMLSEIYTWFTEGFDTRDLQEAKRLVEELA
jgi:predicted ATPase